MSELENKVNYHDLTSLAQLKHSKGGNDDAALKQAAKQFESIFMGMLLSSMRKANEVFEDDGVLNSNATKFYQDMYDKQLSTELSEKGSLGLADLLVQQLRPTKGKTTPASMLKLPTEAALVPERAIRAEASQSAEVESAKIAARNQQELKVPQQPTPAPAVVTETLATETETETATETETENDDWTFASPGEFIEKLMPAAKQAAQKLGLEPLALLAQAALETFEADLLEQPAVVRDRVAPFVVVVVDIDRIGCAPETALEAIFAFECGGRFYGCHVVELLCRCRHTRDVYAR